MTSPLDTVPSHRSRYSGIWNPERISLDPKGVSLLIAGVGATGSALARQLSQAGADSFAVADFDSVAEENLGPQGWDGEDIGKPKVEVLTRDLALRKCLLNNHNARAENVPNLERFDILALCLDNIPSRKAVFEAWRTARLLATKDSGLLIDPRSTAWSTEIVTYQWPVNDKEHIGCDPCPYLSTLPPPSAEQQEPCTASVTNYSAQIVAGYCVDTIVRYLSGWEPHPYFNINLKSRSSILLPCHPRPWLNTPVPSEVSNG